ncbi:alpha-(1,3)-fucosyltransferase C-like [Daphnia carinata]|uniref:alpha-(1,3)-fucosyltransferase C-like n=1 Tax=Daphnia carinata TaxID=120202 RepID=UPI00257ECF5F|nr:alpha-(1,3)-fucosyltransferase C-like [Daphnia carinata]
MKFHRLNLFKRIIVTILGIFFIVVVVFRRRGTLPPSLSSINFNSIRDDLPAETSEEVNVKRKIVLYWNTFYNQTDMTFGFGQQPFIDAGCQITNCIATNDRSLFSQSDGVIIHAGDYQERDLPTHRLPHQRFIMLLFETLPGGHQLPFFSRPHFYNWTMTHRRDSDIYLSKSYGALRRRRNAETINQLPPKLKPGQTLPKPRDLFTRTYPELANRTKLIAWFNSHCPTHSQREDYVKRLAEFIPVDIYGKCGTLECLPYNDPRCDTRILVNYRFYLAAENSLCPDYVTEKFYRALMNDIVPVVFGGADYSQYAPPNSYVNIADFQSPKELAEYLMLLAKNDALYNKYFDWKKDYEVIRKPLNGWCDLCEKLNDPTVESKSYESVAKWWYDETPCLAGSSYIKSMFQTVK